MEEKTPLAGDTPCVAARHNNYKRFVTMCRLSLLLSLISLAYSFCSTFRHPESITIDFSPRGLCPRVPSIPLQTIFTMPGDMYKGLVVEQRGRNEDLTIVDGYTHLVHNPKLDATVVRFDLHLVNKEDEDHIVISRDEPEAGILRLLLEVDKEHLDLHQRNRVCIKMHLTIETPTLDALEVLKIGISQSNIMFIDKGFTFKQELNLATTKGFIRFEDVTTSIATLANVQGDVIANFERLGGNDLTATVSQANVAINVTAVDTPAHMSIHASQGDATVILPDRFNPAFKVSAVMGHITVAADVHPEKLHIERKGFSEYRGYYGNSKDAIADNEIKVSVVMGDSMLKFV